VTEYRDPDLETIAPLPPLPPSIPVPLVEPTPAPAHQRSSVAIAAVVALIVVALVVGFGTATIVLNARDSSPGTIATTPSEDDSVLGGLIVRQRDVVAGNTVFLINRGDDLGIATLDLCNGTFPSETQRVARLQVALVGARGLTELSTEAVLYGTASGSEQAFGELRSVVAQCPPNPVKSPVGEGTATTKFRPAPDGAWPRTPSVERLAYDLVSTDAATDAAKHSMAIYLRRGRALIGLYFPQPDGPQTSVGGRTTIAGIVGLFEARLARVPAEVIGG
jgi:hypothetical protein